MRKDIKYMLCMTFMLSMMMPEALWSQPGGVFVDKRHNAIFLELGGIAGHYSLNYDYVFSFKHVLLLSGGVGFAPSLVERDITFSPRIPIRINAMLGILDHYAAIGLGNTVFWNKEQQLQNAVFFTVGYRYQPWGGGLFFKADFTPLLFESEHTYFPWGGISAGYCF